MEKILRKEELTGHDVFELQRGYLEDLHGLEDSIYLTEEGLDHTGLNKMFEECLDNFNYYGFNRVSKAEWDTIKKRIDESKVGSNKVIFEQIGHWVNECFENHDHFKVLGL